MPQTARSLNGLWQERKTTKDSKGEKTEERRQDKRMYGQLARNSDEKPVDKEQPQRRLNSVETKGETESRTAADQATSTNCSENRIPNEGQVGKCRDVTSVKKLLTA